MTVAENGINGLEAGVYILDRITLKLSYSMQGDQLNMTVFFRDLVKWDLSSVHCTQKVPEKHGHVELRHTSHDWSKLYAIIQPPHKVQVPPNRNLKKKSQTFFQLLLSFFFPLKKMFY